MNGTYTVFLIAKYQVPRYQVKDLTYGHIVVDYQPQKKEPHRTRLIVGRNFIFYSGDVNTPTVDITTAKLIIKNTISTPGASYIYCDIKNFYLGTPFSRYEYIKFQLISY